jgi:NTE family protein
MFDPHTASLQDGPVRRIPSDPDPNEQLLRPVPALCLSGGGFRAMLFHLGALWRLNEVGVLGQLDRISSVSGGSIIAGILGLNWNRLDFKNGVATGFEEFVVVPIRSLARHTIDLKAGINALIPFESIADGIADAYRTHLYGKNTLQDLPDHPRFIFNATNVQSKVLWRFSKPYTWDYRVGKIDRPVISLAVAVGASSAFPPFLSPAVLKFEESDFTPKSGFDLQKPPYTTNVVLTDGGVYDNLGLETAWKQYKTILVSDGGGLAADDPHPHHDWPRHAVRALDIIDNQVRSLRKRQLIDAYRQDERSGAYWGIRTDISNYGVESLDCPPAATILLAGIGTRLAALDDPTQERLINWGYAVCDAAVRAHCRTLVPKVAMGIFPYPRGVN